MNDKRLGRITVQEVELAKEICRKAGDEPNRPRWMDYVEQARATIAARKAAKE